MTEVTPGALRQERMNDMNTKNHIEFVDTSGTLPSCSFSQKVQFKHCDPAGIVFYPRFIEMINDTVEAMFDEALGWPFEVFLRDGGVPTASIGVDFLTPSRHGDQLDIVIDKLERASMGLVITALSGGSIRFRESMTLAYIDGDDRPQPWPDTVRSQITHKGKLAWA
jgi:4-hydroxybenzoyl-CoA thioesterase